MTEFIETIRSTIQTQIAKAQSEEPKPSLIEAKSDPKPSPVEAKSDPKPSPVEANCSSPKVEEQKEAIKSIVIEERKL